MTYDPSDHFIDLPQGKKTVKYLPVQYRIQWLREDHGDTYGVESTLLEHDRQAGYALFKTTLRNMEGRIIAEAHGWEIKANFPDYIGKAETVAVGRALAYAGFGTVGAAEFDLTNSKGELRIVDAGTEEEIRTIGTVAPPIPSDVACTECNNLIAGFQIPGGPFIQAEEVIKKSTALTGAALCHKCYAKVQKARKAS
jgi:hypothetical protein